MNVCAVTRYDVSQISSQVITPFFEEHPLVTAKADDFNTFAGIVRMMVQESSPQCGGHELDCGV